MALDFEKDFKDAAGSIIGREQILGFVAGHDNLPTQNPEPEAAPGQNSI